MPSLYCCDGWLACWLAGWLVACFFAHSFCCFANVQHFSSLCVLVVSLSLFYLVFFFSAGVFLFSLEFVFPSTSTCTISIVVVFVYCQCVRSLFFFRFAYHFHTLLHLLRRTPFVRKNFLLNHTTTPSRHHIGASILPFTIRSFRSITNNNFHSIH